MSLAGSDPAEKKGTFHGIITDDARAEVSFRCSHSHRSRYLAVQCAEKEIKRRENR